MDAESYLDAYDHLHRRIAQAGDWAALNGLVETIDAAALRGELDTEEVDALCAAIRHQAQATDGAQ